MLTLTIPLTSESGVGSNAIKDLALKSHLSYSDILKNSTFTEYILSSGKVVVLNYSRVPSSINMVPKNIEALGKSLNLTNDDLRILQVPHSYKGLKHSKTQIDSSAVKSLLREIQGSQYVAIIQENGRAAISQIIQ